MMHNDWMWANFSGWAGWVLFCVATTVFCAAVIVALVLVIRYAGGSRDAAGGLPTYGPSRAEDVLAERFARGDIDEDDYRRRVMLLNEHR